MAAVAPQLLVDALTRLASALDGDDPLAAGDASDGVGAAIAALQDTKLPAATIDEARLLLARCEERAARMTASLRNALLQSSLHRKAAHSYASAPTVEEER